MLPCSTGSGRFKELTIQLCQREKSGGRKETAPQVKERSLITQNKYVKDKERGTMWGKAKKKIEGEDERREQEQNRRMQAVWVPQDK